MNDTRRASTTLRFLVESPSSDLPSLAFLGLSSHISSSKLWLLKFGTASALFSPDSGPSVRSAVDASAECIVTVSSNRVNFRVNDSAFSFCQELATKFVTKRPLILVTMYICIVHIGGWLWRTNYNEHCIRFPVACWHVACKLYLGQNRWVHTIDVPRIVVSKKWMYIALRVQVLATAWEKYSSKILSLLTQL